jgi:predicted PurR-regulated permease PerM
MKPPPSSLPRTGDSAHAEPSLDAISGEAAAVHVHLPLDARGSALVLLAVLASAFALKWAGALLIPLLLGLMFSYALSPLVDRLQHWHIPRALGAAVLLLAALGGLGFVSYTLSDDASTLIESLPDAAQKLRDSLQPERGSPESTMEKVQRAAANLEQPTEQRGAASPSAPGVTRVQVERPRFDVKDYLWTGTLGIVGFLGQAMVVCFVAYFLMVAGDRFRRKLAKIAGPTLSQKKVTIEVLDEITAQIQRYVLLQILISVLVGIATWIVFAWIGLAHAAVWGAAAAALNLVPYLGAIAVSGGAALVGFLQFGTLGAALLIAAVSVLIHTLSGNLLTPWLTSRTSRMSPVVIFVGVLAWGWLWGAWGLLLGAPLLMILKSVCDRVDTLQPFGELLGE